MTPDAVCFDALATALALNQAVVMKKEQQKPLLPPATSTSPKSIPDSNNYDTRDDDTNDPLRLVEAPLVLMNGSSSCEPVLEAAMPVHDVLALSVCIPIPSLLSLNTHGQIDTLLHGG